MRTRKVTYIGTKRAEERVGSPVVSVRNIHEGMDWGLRPVRRTDVAWVLEVGVEPLDPYVEAWYDGTPR